MATTSTPTSYPRRSQGKGRGSDPFSSSIMSWTGVSGGSGGKRGGGNRGNGRGGQQAVRLATAPPEVSLPPSQPLPPSQVRPPANGPADFCPYGNECPWGVCCRYRHTRDTPVPNPYLNDPAIRHPPLPTDPLGTVQYGRGVAVTKMYDDDESAEDDDETPVARVHEVCTRMLEVLLDEDSPYSLAYVLRDCAERGCPYLHVAGVEGAAQAAAELCDPTATALLEEGKKRGWHGRRPENTSHCDNSIDEMKVQWVSCCKMEAKSDPETFARFMVCVFYYFAFPLQPPPPPLHKCCSCSQKAAPAAGGEYLELIAYDIPKCGPKVAEASSARRGDDAIKRPKPQENKPNNRVRRDKKS